MTTTFLRRARLLALAITPLVGAACNDFLNVTNPGAVVTEDIADSAFAGLLVNGAVSEFQQAYGTHGLYTAVFSDELRNHHVFQENRDIDRRAILPENGTYALVYSQLQRARFIADTATILLKGYGIGPTQADTLNRRVAIARALTYAGFATTLLGEAFCSIPINGSAPFEPDSIFGMAATRFNEAITVATAARAGALSAAQQTLADSMLFAARVGLGRALLNRNRATEAATAVQGVPATFQFLAYYSANSTRENNPWFNAAVLSGASRWVALEPKWKRLNDPRVPHPTLPEAVMDGARTDTVSGTSGAFVPNATSAMGGWLSTSATGADVTLASSLRIASGLEAQYIAAEAAGPVASTLTFVNARRTANLQPTVNLTGDALMADLREQRARDLFLDGHRLGDMRRYLRYNNVNFYQTGLYPGLTTGETYGTQTCMPLTSGERLGNPNVPPNAP